MRTTTRSADQWLSLSHAQLVEQVRRCTRERNPGTWDRVREHPVLAARVRGVLSALRAETSVTRDAAMWALWISQAQQRLNAPAPAPVVTAPTLPKQVIREPEITLSVPAPAARPVRPVPVVQFSSPDA
ncbi:hypothetical protein [Umezawaea beigongshangensis]|uniref:hypothetical protein n=1 Tax=Umezawaea beigongshangensis TaxID=2780383 RepID=UPI0018F21F43|nr:hypothetical protein [Umezawaea beigongshangensis]